MLQRDFGYRIYRALTALPSKDEKKEKKDKTRKDADRKEGDRRDTKKEKEEENSEPVSKRSREEEDKKRVSECYTLPIVLAHTNFTDSCPIYRVNFCCVFTVKLEFGQSGCIFGTTFYQLDLQLTSVNIINDSCKNESQCLYVYHYKLN